MVHYKIAEISRNFAKLRSIRPVFFISWFTGFFFSELVRGGGGGGGKLLKLTGHFQSFIFNICKTSKVISSLNISSFS